MIQEIRETVDKGNLAVGVFVDFQKAFDTVNHKILLHKLEHYGVRGVAKKWFHSYLENRQQSVSINGSISDTEYIKHGVPQGSVLGPLLFLIYINDLNRCINFSTTRHFADDTNLLYTVERSKSRNRNPVRNLNKDLKSLNHWLLANKISLNATKTELIIFRNKKTPKPILKIKLNGVKLIETNEVKYVGLTIDKHLTFENHITILNAKLKRANNLLAISRHYLPSNLLKWPILLPSYIWMPSMGARPKPNYENSQTPRKSSLHNLLCRFQCRSQSPLQSTKYTKTK